MELADSSGRRSVGLFRQACAERARQVNYPCPQCGSDRASIEAACGTCGWLPKPPRETRVNEEEPIRYVACPECGAEVSQGAGRCWLCGHESGFLAQSAGDVVPEPRLQFGIASILLTITLVAVMLGVLRLVPGLGITLIVVVTPAFLRVTLFAARQRAAGRPLSIAQKVLTFLSSVSLVVSVALSAGLAFFVTCLGGLFVIDKIKPSRDYFGLDHLPYGMMIGGFAQIIFTALFVRFLWRRRGQQRNRLGDIAFIFSWIGFAAAAFVLAANVAFGWTQAREMWALGLPALPGLILGPVAIRRPQKMLASWGIGLALGTAVLSGSMWLDWATYTSLTSGRLKPALVLGIGTITAVAVSVVLHAAVKQRICRTSVLIL